MIIFTKFVNVLDTYYPLSYAIAFSFGAICSVVLLRLFISIWATFNQRLTTRKHTYVEFKMDKDRINLVNQSNIYQEPGCALIVTEKVQPNRAQNRAQRKGNVSSKEPSKVIEAHISVYFAKPINGDSMLTRIEGISGEIPRRESSAINEKGAKIHLSNIHDGCYFRIHFNRENDNK